MTAVMPCDCTHLKVQHAGATYACRDCDCKRYTPDIQQAARDGESISARLRRDDQGRDELRNEVVQAIALGGDYARERDEWKAAAQSWSDRYAEACRAGHVLQAELASARTELEQLRAELAHTKTEGGTDA